MRKHDIDSGRMMGMEKDLLPPTYKSGVGVKDVIAINSPQDQSPRVP